MKIRDKGEKLVVLTAMVTAIALGGCASDSPPDERPQVEQQPFGVSSCSTASADDILAITRGGSAGIQVGGSDPPVGASGGTFPLAGGPPTSIERLSPSSYNTCFRSFVVDIPNLNPIFVGLKKTEHGRAGRIVATWHGPRPTTQQACESAWSGTIVYKQSGGAWLPLTSDVNHFGQWQGGSTGCLLPGFASDSEGLVLEPNASYRLAVTMRRAYGSSVLYSIGYSTQVPY